ncbi:fused MFS/spermidine synthase [Luminiphilus sp.]|nr:fused MFS/spermidine synthase [Luminiphilus sp.]
MLIQVTSKRLLVSLAFATFLGAYLSFQVQPLVAQWMLPKFGGTAAVWSATMLFFQVGLLLGYGYSFALTKYLSVNQQVLIHCGLLGFSCLLLPWGAPSAPLVPQNATPTVAVLLSLLGVVGVPYVLVTATAPLLQAWGYSFSATNSPYRLYVVSNLGSLLGLLLYPFLVGPSLNLQQQFLVWSVLFIVFFGVFLALGKYAKNEGMAGREPIVEPAPSDLQRREKKVFSYLYWAGLSGAGSVLLLATTNFISQDVAVTPLVWVLPFCLYLVSFIVTFDHTRWYQRRVWFPLGLLTSIYATDFFIRHYRSGIAAINEQLAVFLVALFVGCMVLHGELFRSKPEPQRLPTFYVWLALGGAVGGGFVNFIAPTLFSEFWELPVGLLTVTFVTVVVSFYQASHHENHLSASVFSVVASIALIVGSLSVLALAKAERADVITAKRGFYGVLKVREADVGRPEHRKTLYYGQINHGAEYLNEPFSSTPLSYYDRDSGIGVVMAALDNGGGVSGEQNKDVGILGLGAGALTTYLRSGDHFTFYELNPQVVEIARNDFSYLAGRDRDVTIIMGDGRVSLARPSNSNSRQFDVLVIDAFSGDAIPTHLLTREAFEVYRSRLKPTGILAVHISNRFLDLQPLMYGLAESLEWQSALVRRPPSSDGRIKRSTWVIMGANQEFFAGQRDWKYFQEWAPQVKQRQLVWTDDAINIFPLLD